MKSTFLHHLAVITLTATSLTGCAPTASTDSAVAVTQTETMGGQAAAEAEPDTTEIDYSRMFAEVGNTAQYTLAELAAMDPNLSTFSTLLDQAELTDALMAEKSLTLLAPTNQAFSSWPQDSVNMLMKPEHKARLIRLLQAHLLLRETSSLGLSNNQSIETSGGEYITVSTDDHTVTVGEATIVRPDIRASNGVLHVVDKVLRTAEGVRADQ
ncbi:fasciclin domain-containing protein [Pontibacter kalidii]|uniref:fasciclin domain-containing protein n=1 Tax=Pontibacter kalidii TaxID=2592049 RepID=UPI00224FAAF8|nr:fasciclin domain-containing protein [Pontibacter kalidii]